MVRILLNDRLAQRKLYKEESGTTQDDTNLTDAIDQWQKFIDDYEAILGDKST
jgi:hypothetical protein